MVLHVHTLDNFNSLTKTIKRAFNIITVLPQSIVQKNCIININP